MWEILQDLGTLGGNFLLHCLEDRSNFRFLHVSKINQFPKENAPLSFPQYTFSLKVFQSLWNESSLERLLVDFYQQIMQAEVCLKWEIEQEDQSSL
jgi:hypothetical protein